MQVLLAVLMLSSGATSSTRVLFELEARFLCAELRPIPLEVMERTQVSLEVPKGCPDSGTKLSVELDCRSGRCSGTLQRDHQPVATLEEREGSLVVTTPARFEAGPTSKLAIKVSSRQVVAVEGAPLPLVIAARSSEGTCHAEFLATWEQSMSLKLGGGDFTLQYSRPDATHVTLDVDSPGKVHVTRTLLLGEPLVVSCAASKLTCSGTLTFEAHERN